MVWKNFFFGMLLGGLMLSGGVAVWGRQEAKVLSVTVALPTSTPTFNPTPTPLPTPTPTPTKKPTPKPTPTATPIPVPTATSQEINGFIDRFSSQYGVDPNVLRHTAICESGFNPGATNGSYVGLFQFGPITWQKYRSLMGEDASIVLRVNAEEAVQTAAYVYSTGASRIWPNCVPGS